MGFYAINEGSGPTLYDATGQGPALIGSGFGSNAPWGSGPGGAALDCSTATQEGAAAALAAGPPFPLSIACGWRWLTLPSSINTPLCDIWSAATGRVIGMEATGSGSTVTLLFYSNGNAVTLSSSLALATDYVCSGSVTTTGSQRGYINGVISSTLITAGGTPSYSSPSISVGNTHFSGRNCGALISWFGVWNRVLSADEHAAIGAGPSAIFGRVFGTPRSYFLMRPSAVTTTLVRRTLSDRAGSRGAA
jgi:hypothetical protein